MTATPTAAMMAPTMAPALRRRTRTVTLDAHEAVADQGAADAGDDDSPEGDGPGLA